MPSFWRTQKPCLEHAEKNCDDIVFSTFIHGIRMYSSVSNKDEYARFLLSDLEGTRLNGFSARVQQGLRD